MTNVEKIRSNLSGRTSNINLFVYDCVTSTNDLAKEFVKDGFDKETVIISREQTAGRGRRGRSFFSPDATGIYMSIVLRPECPVELLSLLTPAAAVATAKSLEKASGKKVDIKWINDIFLDGKKICGILCETSFDSTRKMPSVVVGIGINLCDPRGGFPEEISEIASSLFGSAAMDEDVPSMICAEIINLLVDYSDSIVERPFLEEYKKRMFLLGKEITVISGTDAYLATVTDIDDDAHLTVTLPDNSVKVLNAGEISIKPFAPIKKG